MKLHLLIDTCVWLDIAKGHKYLPHLDSLKVMKKTGALEIILPEIVVTEFNRNKERIITSHKQSFRTHFKEVRAAISKLDLEAERDASLQVLDDMKHKISIDAEAVDEAMIIIEEIFATTPHIPLTDSVKIRATERALKKAAPFHGEHNSIGDAIIIETYIDSLAEKSNNDVYCFVTLNTNCFGKRGGDTRFPHPDLAEIFSDNNSRYVTSLEPLLGEFAEDVLEEARFEREFSSEPRRLSELMEAEHKLFTQVWYNRHMNRRYTISTGEHRVVSNEEWEKLPITERFNTVVDTVWERALAAATRAEEELGPDAIGPWDDFEWGMINGKLSAIRWMLGDDWDMLDT